ncbi:MAG: hypothetical protein OEV47_16225 [Gammaproteobacteria bacterium]|nr:hypothetical protein [Gammaproteobacteria bacterium]
MNKFDKDTRTADLDREIAGRFAQMRAGEAASAPAFKRQNITATESARPEKVRTVTWVLPRLAAAIAVVAVAVSLLRGTPQEDPAALYASIMQHQQVQTDSLLLVSDSVLPEMRSVPRLYELEYAFTPEGETQ